MIELELEQKILDYIRITYKANYTGFLKVEKFPSTYPSYDSNPGPGYRFSIGIPSYMFPTTIACDFLTDQEFLDFIYSELNTRNYMRVYFYKVKRTENSKEE